MELEVGAQIAALLLSLAQALQHAVGQKFDSADLVISDGCYLLNDRLRETIAFV